MKSLCPADCNLFERVDLDSINQIEMQRPISDSGTIDLDIIFFQPAVAVPERQDEPVPMKEGVFKPLKTTLEMRAIEDTVRVYVTAVPAKLASAVLNLVRKLLPDDGGIDFQHLRRFAKPRDLPPRVQQLLSSSPTPAELFLIAGPVSAIPFTDVNLALNPILGDVYMAEVDVPMLAPTSQEQAKTWSAKYWPTVYKKSNPFGPHPSIVERAEEEMRDEIVLYMNLAERVAGEALESGGGERVGVVVVERKEGRGRIVAVAGDSRWSSWAWGREKGGSGIVVAHAVMRAIGMVAGGLKAREEEVGIARLGPSDAELEDPMLGCGAEEKVTEMPAVISESTSLDDGAPNIECENKDTQPLENPPSSTIPTGKPASPPNMAPGADPIAHRTSDIFRDSASSEIEKEHYNPSGNENGYLCHELEIYCTHEPCVMCSMAIVHSRFGRVVFRRRMGATGGLCADEDLGHGLFWRKELNWTLLGWQWFRDVGDEEKEGEQEVNTHLHA